MSILVKNTSEESAPAAAPIRPDGGYYRFEMICDNGWVRIYDDTSTGLLDHLIPGYASLPDSDKLAARVRHAVDVQVPLQASLNQNYAESPRTEAEQAILTGPRFVQPTVDTWNCYVPLVLVDAFYQPFSDKNAPASGLADTLDAPNLWMLRPAANEMEYLRSLHETFVITLNIARDEIV